MKRIYKLIITHDEFYHEVALNSVAQEDDQSSSMITLPRNGSDAIGLAVLCRDANCILSSNSPILFQDKNGVIGHDVKLRCGDLVNILDQSGKHILYHCEMALASTVKDDGSILEFDIGFGVQEEFVVGGGTSATVKIAEALLGEDYISFVYRDNRVFINDFKAQFGLFINGIRTYKMCEVRNYSFISIDGVQFYLKDGYLFTDSDYGLQIPSHWQVIHMEPSTSQLTYPKFNRSTRMQIDFKKDPITILTPPSVPQKQKTNLVLTLLPSIAMILLIIVIRGNMSGSNSSFILFSVCSMGVGILTSILTFFSGKKEHSKALVERTEQYTEYINRKRTEITESRKEELEQMNETYHDLKRDIAAVQQFTSDMFDRLPAHSDFLHVYLGKGQCKALRPVEYKKQEQIVLGDELFALPEQVQKEYRNIAEAPVVLDLASAGSVGFVGQTQQLYAQMKGLTLDICIRHYYRDVQLFYIINTDYADKIMWLRWLPHIKNMELGARNIVCSAESKNELLEYLYVLMTRRAQEKCKYPHIVVFVLNDIGIKTHPVSQYFSNSKELGVTFVFFEEYPELLPENCSSIVELQGNSQGTLTSSTNAGESVAFSYSVCDDAIAEQVALKLAPVYCEEVNLENTLRKSISFFEVLGIWSADDLNLEKAWAEADVTRSLAAPIGVNAKDALISLDIHEKAHGPHGLVAGTTGSGKSELLQSYILSMATKYHPYEVGFVIIDFKGGGMANQFENLPHLIGAITNIDGDEINRSLQSIKAELHKRQVLFDEYDVNKIDDYIRKFKTGVAKVALPHLIIVVDEFAELKADQPEFMKELISAARIGRSLGIHLILATQKPSGQVNEQIWSNSRFKLCLKVQSQGDSNEVLKSPLAAEIREPGRAYLQVGNNEMFELLQSGYSGCPADASQNTSVDFSLAEVSLWGKHEVVYETKKTRGNHQAQSQLQAVVKKIADYCTAAGIQPLPNICLPALPEVLPYPETLSAISGQGTFADIGIFDDPSSQYQGKISIDLEENNVIAIGSTQYGKTNLMMTMIRSLADRYTPSEVNMYIIDFGPSIIGNFKNLPHVGGVVTDKEDEKLKNLFKMLFNEIDERKDRLLRANVSSFKSYKEAGHKDMPMIVLFVDNFTALKELYLAEEDFLMPLCRNGLSVGISVVMANAHTQGIGYRYLSNFSKRIALYCNDSGEYSTVIEHCRVRPKDVVGRGVIELDKKVYEFQTYCSFAGNTEMKRVEEMNSFIGQIQEHSHGKTAKKIPEIPNKLTERALVESFGAERKDTYLVPVGVDYTSLMPVSIDLLQVGAFATIGTETPESKFFLQMVVNQLQHNLFSTPAQMYLIDNVQRGLKPYRELGITERYTIDPSEFVECVSEIHGVLRSRFETVNEDGLDALRDEPLIFVVVNNADAIAALCKNTTVLGKYKEILDKYASLKICFLYVNIDNLAVNSYSGPEVLKRLKESKSVFFFGPLKKMKFMDISDRQQRSFKKERLYGDGYYYADGELCKLKIVTEM